MISDFLNSVEYQGQPLGQGGVVNLAGGKKPWLNTGAGQLWGNFSAWAGGPEGPIEQGYQSALQGLLEGYAAEEDQSDEALRNALAAQGIDPSMAAAIVASQKGARAGKLGAGKAQLETSKAGDFLNLGLGTTNALTQAAQYDAGMAFNQYALKKQLKAAKQASQLGFLGDLVGAAAMFFAPPAAAPLMKAGKAAGGSLNSGSDWSTKFGSTDY